MEPSSSGAREDSAHTTTSTVLPRAGSSLRLLTRLYYATTIFALQALLIKPVLFVQAILAWLNPPRNRPHIVRTYNCRRHLPIRIFFPQFYDRNAAHPLPTLFTIHGGGFIMGTPDSNDHWNSHFASSHSAVVIALNYSKAPGAPFPRPIHDLVALFHAALDDPDLIQHIDRSRIALAGWSAGGNLALAISQLPSVRDCLIAVVPMYPLIDFTIPYAQKARTRRYKPALGGFRARETDYLLGMMPMFDWAYLPVGQDLQDPLVCPVFAARETLPRRVFVLGCEMDMLGQEAWRFACKLAGREVPGIEDVVGQEKVARKKGELILGDERFHWDVKGGKGSEESSYRWLLVPDTIHGFDQEIGTMVKDPELMADAKAKTNECIQLIGEWLFPRS